MLIRHNETISVWSEPTICQLLVIICTKHFSVISVGGGAGSQSNSGAVSVCETEESFVLSKNLADLNLQPSDWPACHSCLKGEQKEHHTHWWQRGEVCHSQERTAVNQSDPLAPAHGSPAPPLVAHTWKQRMLVGKLKLRVWFEIREELSEEEEGQKRTETRKKNEEARDKTL